MRQYAPMRRLREAVQIARAHGRSWNHIAVALGVSPHSGRSGRVG